MGCLPEAPNTVDFTAVWCTDIGGRQKLEQERNLLNKIDYASYELSRLASSHIAVTSAFAYSLL